MTVDYYAHVIRRQKMKKARRNMKNGRRLALTAGRLYAPRPETVRRSKSPKSSKKPFVGVDGEGGGTNERGQQHYRLLRAGERVLFNNNKPLGTVECLNFILSLPKRPYYVGFSFGYDATMILRDLPGDYVAKLFQRRDGSNYTYWFDFAIDYLPGHYFRVARINPAGDGVIDGTARTVWETFAFFQSSFVKTLDTWGIGDKALRAKMEKTKKSRGTFVRMTPKIIEYNRQECIWLAELMEKFRERSEQCNLVPRTWNGPGKIASQLLRRHGVIRKEAVVATLAPEVLDYAQHAFYGGRAELAWVGVLEGVYGYDIKSAYPAAMLDVPCIEHGTWHAVLPEQLAWLSEGDLFLAKCTYLHPKKQIWCGLPHRDMSGALSWPKKGGGIYWSQEIFAARRAGARVRLTSAFLYERRCSCRPLGFVAQVFKQRQALDRIEKGLGLPLKLAINSLYGKFAQRVGEAPYQNHLWAGFITAACRAKVLDAVTLAGEKNAVMVATDSVYSRVALPLDLGDELGNWEEQGEVKTLLFIKPGIYWEPNTDEGLLKIRGLSLKALTEREKDKPTGKEQVEAAWKDYERRVRNSDDRALNAYKSTAAGQRLAPRPYPVLKLAMNGFVGLRLAAAQGDLKKAGAWTRDLAKRDPEANVRRLGFSWGTKRADWVIEEICDAAAGLAILTRPREGGPHSSHWAAEVDTLQGKEADLMRYWAEGQPDYLDPGEDI